MQGVLCAIADTTRKHNERYWQWTSRATGASGDGFSRHSASLDILVDRYQLTQRKTDENDRIRKGRYQNEDTHKVVRQAELGVERWWQVGQRGQQ